MQDPSPIEIQARATALIIAASFLGPRDWKGKLRNLPSEPGAKKEEIYLILSQYLDDLEKVAAQFRDQVSHYLKTGELDRKK